MATAKNGDTVKVHYTGKLENGTVFDSSEGRPPLEFKIGEKKVIPGFENGVIGMEEGQSKNITIPKDEAYGDRREELTQQISRKQIPPSIEPKVGQRLQMQQPDGQAFEVVVSALDDESVTIDANHPLAGETLHFDIKLEEIK